MCPVQEQNLLPKENRFSAQKNPGSNRRQILLHREARQLSRGMIDTDPIVGKRRTRQMRGEKTLLLREGRQKGGRIHRPRADTGPC